MSMWRCWNCKHSENEMDEQCQLCNKLLAEYPGEDFHAILVQRQRVVLEGKVNKGQKQQQQKPA